MANVTEQTIKLKTGDNLSLAATVFQPVTQSTIQTLVIGSALGVPRYFYYKFAHFFAENGFFVITFDYRGIYQSRIDGLPGSEMKMEEWGTEDIEAALNYALEELNTEQLVYLGHSCGGQLLGLAPSSKRIDSIVLIASQLGYWKLWPPPYNIGVYLVWRLLLMMVPFFDYIPTKFLGISSVNLPAGVAKQWAQWGTSPDYLFDKVHQINTSRYSELNIPMLAYHFDDDLLLAPPKSVDALLDKYSSAHIEKRTVKHESVKQKKIGHFGFFKERLKTPLWQETVSWVHD